MELTVEVTTNDIAQGKAFSSTSCPMAAAINRAMPGYIAAVLNNGILPYIIVRLFPADEHTLYASEYESCESRKACEFVTKFDRGEKVGPGEFSFVFKKQR